MNSVIHSEEVASWPFYGAVAWIPRVHDFVLEGITNLDVGRDGAQDRVLVLNTAEEVISCFQFEALLSAIVGGKARVHVHSLVDDVHIETDRLNKGVLNFISSRVFEPFEVVVCDGL